MFYKSNIVNAFPIHSSTESKVGAVGSITPPSPTGVDLYSRFAFAGAVCCSVTHGALTPVDVVKTRIQLEPEVYNKVCLSLVSTPSPRRVAQRRNAGNVRHGVASVFGVLQSFRWPFKHERLLFKCCAVVLRIRPLTRFPPFHPGNGSCFPPGCPERGCWCTFDRLRAYCTRICFPRRLQVWWL